MDTVDSIGTLPYNVIYIISNTTFVTHHTNSNKFKSPKKWLLKGHVYSYILIQQQEKNKRKQTINRTTGHSLISTNKIRICQRLLICPGITCRQDSLTEKLHACAVAR